MAGPQVIQSVGPSDFDQMAAHHLDGLGDLPLDYFKGLWDAREVNLFGLFEDGVRVGTMLMRWGTEKATGEVIAEVVALAGKGETDLTGGALNYAELAARSKGADKLMFNTRRPGLVRKLAHKAEEVEVNVSWRL